MPESEQGVNIDVVQLGIELNKSVVHSNISQSVIAITEDKARIILIQHKESLQASRDWVAPSGVLLAIVTTLATADFRPALSVSKDAMQAVFVIGAFGSGIWLIWAFWRCYKVRGCRDIDKIIASMKQR